MAHSVQSYQGRHEVINDLDLLIVIGIALRLAHQSARFETLAGLLEDWQKALDTYGPGILDLNLDQLVQTSDSAGDLKVLLDMILEQISKYDETIPAAVINEKLSIRGVTFNDYNTSFIEEAVKKVQTLIS